MSKQVKVEIDQLLSKAQRLGDLLPALESLFVAQDLFFGHGTDNAWDEAVYLCLAALDLPLESGEEVLDFPLDAAKKAKLANWLYQRVIDKKPLAYLMQKAYFAGLEFYVDERVIIPRSPMAEWLARGFMPWLASNRVTRILDLCTGSGCIAIAAAYAFEHATVDAVELSPDALAVAKINRDKHQLNKRLNLLQGNLFEPVREKYQLIISNPPYVSEAEMATLPPEYLHEPKMALTATHEGMAIAVQIINQAKHYLTADGILVLELGHGYQAIEPIFPRLAFNWLDFEQGGEGICLLTGEDLAQLA